MDFSQLPKMSKTPPAPSGEPAEGTPTVVNPEAVARTPAAPLEYYHRAPEPSFVSVWVSLVVGLLCLMMGWNFARWLMASVSRRPFETNVFWTTGDRAGQSVGYFELQSGSAWTDTGIFLMGVALLIDALVMIFALRGRTPSRALVAVAIGVTGIALLINICLGVYLLTIGVMPVVSLIVILVGGFVLFDHVPMLGRRRN